MEYQYPISLDWNTQEIIDVIHLLQMVEQAYEKGVERDSFMAAYRRFKEIVPSKSEEKKIGHEFEEMSGYSIYRTVKAVKDSSPGTVVKM